MLLQWTKSMRMGNAHWCGHWELRDIPRLSKYRARLNYHLLLVLGSLVKFSECPNPMGGSFTLHPKKRKKEKSGVELVKGVLHFFVFVPSFQIGNYILKKN